MASSPYVLRIDPAMIANPAPRLELREFVKSPERLTLFVRAFRNVQARPATRSDSFARIASIHGSPVPFEDINPFPDEEFRGYCQHGSQLFGPWHRPYIMMLEVELYKEVNRLAAEYSAASYREAAKAFRFPYWDWGIIVPLRPGETRPRDWLPDILSSLEVQITLPDGSTTSVRNPVSSFTLTREDRRLLQVPRYLASTLRRPQVVNGAVATSNADVEAALGRTVSNLRSQLTLLLKNPASYVCVSNHTAKPNSLQCSQEENIESIHDNIHGLVGGNNGQMSAVEYAAYDPAFWLHHCNVDRLLALWEGIYPAEKIREGLTELPGIGSDVDIEPTPTASTDPFYPFRKSANDDDWWTSVDVMAAYDPNGLGTRRLGYYYPEFQDPKVTPAQLLAKVDTLYNDNPNSRRVFLNLPAIDTSRVPGSFNLRVDVQPDTAPAPGTRALPMGPIHAGTVCLFKRLNRARCDNCSRHTPLQRANLDITDTLAKVQRDAPASWNNLKLVLQAVPLGQGAPQAGTNIPVGNATIFTVVNGRITSRTRLPGPPGAAATTGAPPAATTGTRDLPALGPAAPHAAPAHTPDDTLPDFKLQGLQATVILSERPTLDTSI